jgi:hypothetical protein
MRITVRQLKGLIREAVREIIVKRIHENANIVDEREAELIKKRKAELIKKWKVFRRTDSGQTPDTDWAQQMYAAGVALETGDGSELRSLAQLSIDEMQGHYPGFTAKDFKEVAVAVYPDVAGGTAYSDSLPIQHHH